MSDLFKPSNGAVMSADIAVPQHEKMVQFYSQVLTTGEHPFWQKDLMNNLGIPIIGLGAQNAEYGELPLQWMPHIQVTDVAKSAAQALANGGRELLHGKGDDGVSQWAVFEDPNGAAFGLIPVVAESMLPNLDDKNDDELAHMGCIAWLDLTVNNATIIRDFYCAVVGWEAESIGMQDKNCSYSDFNMLNGDGQAAAGICHARGMNSILPPVWLLYLPVGDLTASLEVVEELGGKVINQTKNKAGVVTQALIEDLLGVNLVIVQG